MNRDQLHRLAAYDDEGLDPRERAFLDRLLDDSAEARAYLAALRRDRDRFAEAFAGLKAPAGFAAGVMDRLPVRRGLRPMPRLLELCAGAMMLAVIVSVAGPLLRQDRASLTICQRNAKQLTQAMLSYATDYDGRLPSAERWPVQVAGYAAPADYVCPSDPREPIQTSYGMPMGLGQAELGRLAASREVLVFDAEGPFVAPRHDRDRAAVAGYSDGSVSLIRVGH